MQRETAQIEPEELLSASFRHPVSAITVRETHISLVALTGEFAYKIKKSLRLDFIDSSTLERRRALCEEELRLNRRTAPDLYLDVVPIVRRNGRLCFDAPGEPIEYAVRMRQFDPSQELQALLAAGDVRSAELVELAVTLADFHGRAAPAGAAAGFPCSEAFARFARENAAAVLERAASIDAVDQVRTLERWTNRTLERLGERLGERERTGRVRECHGDLHSRNIVRWRGKLTPFDCIEFDPALRFIDVLNDLAFLVMDLIHRGRTDLAYTTLNAYLERTGDYLGLDLLSCYLVYRALVRAKVDLIAAQQNRRDSASRDRARSRVAAAQAFTRTSAATLVIMHGASGSGKSWLSARLAPLLPAVRVRSDVERKRLAGMDPLAPGAGPHEVDLYSREFNERTYARLLACARAALSGSLSVIVDAAFLDSNERREFAALAHACGARFAIVSCGADQATLAARIEERRRARNDPSDATIAVLERQLATMQPFNEEELGFLVRVDTREPHATTRVLEAIAALRRDA
ncbi:MAG: AAA family ATPase [Steroidobacteraceae bacterium]|jgi:aminoglycoside phosphotransferase family enzyme/predicted kinase|nr:AAA family ATPase [Steroidobacteraceae bacterium]